MNEKKWAKIGRAADLSKKELQQIKIEGKRIALSYREGRFGAISGTCLHAGGPLGDGTIHNDYVVCPWHSWQFHRITGEARPGIPAAVPQHELKEENGDLYVNLNTLTQAKHAPHPRHPLTREIKRESGPLRIAGISATVMNKEYPRYSTSEALLQESLDYAASEHHAETKLIRLNDLKFRSCEGYYSKSAHACTWPCTITQFDSSDELTEVYEAFVFWADAVIIATPIRWGSASSLYYKMVERMNAVQNQMVIADRVLIRNKVVSFIVTGGQDNIQAVAGQMMTFFGELGFTFPQFPFIAHSRGWHAEDMENNVSYVQKSKELREGARALIDRSVALAADLIANEPLCKIARGGRKAR
ncbi:MAG: NAD(P)H-dependent oxidoreductase [Candidatus Aenigmarchaeota archaeon]|nr:NAD(P)H-dependent oxidoreductase [Candidatus Aenigmarchaeota archaeon]